MVDLSFFNKSKEHSKVKAEIVSQYLSVWAKVLCSRADEILYVDLFAGPGRYADGTKSTPLLVLEKAIENPEMCNKLSTIFSDKEIKNAESLEREIKKLGGIEKLKNPPQVYVDEVDNKMTELLQSTNLIPTLTFLDPWGYKGLTLDLIHSVIKDWGSECIIFFNYNRVNMGINNKLVDTHISSLLGEDNLLALRTKVGQMRPVEREYEIMKVFSKQIEGVGGNYVLPFRFISEKRNNTSHFIIFITKHFLGYSLMKGIMANLSSNHIEGVASFEYSSRIQKQPYLLFDESPIEKLKEELLEQFEGQALTVEQIYEKHTVGTPYILKNYKDALLGLEEQSKIIASPEATKRRKIKGKQTLANDVAISFGKKAG